MTQEDKQLLLQDLCARLPHHCRVFYEYVDDLDGKTYGYSLTLNTWCIDEFNADKAVVKSYLRSLSSMTEEEDKEWQLYKNNIACACDENLNERINELYDWFNKHHFDYHGLISMDLALEAPEDMYNIN